MAQLIKEVVDGRTTYRKPKKHNKDGSVKDGYDYKPARKSKNSWRFKNTANMSQEVWEIGQAYIIKMINADQRPKRRLSHPADLTKLLYFLFLTGARQQEAFMKPYFDLEFQERKGLTWVEVRHPNQKQKKEKNKTVKCIFPIFDEWEQRMWNFISDGGRLKRGDQILQYGNWRSTKKNNITMLFTKNFKTLLENEDDPNEKPIETGVPPHLLRHMRAYDILVNYGIDKKDVQKMFGWGSDMMVYYYADINRQLTKEEQVKRFMDAGVLTNLKIEDADLLTQSRPRV